MVSSRRFLVVQVLLFCLASMLPSGCAHHRHRKDGNAVPTGRSLVILKTAAYQDWAAVRNHMRRDCNIEAGIPAMVRKFAEKEDYDHVFLSEEAPRDTPAPVLTITIKDAKGLDGGIMTGAKYIVVEGTLTRGGAVVGTFIDMQASAWGHAKLRGIMHPRKQANASTCKLLFQCAEAVGKDIVEWLDNPTMNAVLGNAARLKEVQAEPATNR